ncbi:hypothetical protein INT45_008602 [Circinella minor]|uniref:Reverse transcriptase RNase H-like domain-containing protein n=1 Tax=Circinella minor TaxID=1195481 RepID=A0A8H7VE68_9FUNG|nr:hypothetical protein INT45_008602 [Circinella minor]
MLVSLPCLAYPNANMPYNLHVDASDVGLGSVLVQQERPIAYASHILTNAERNYSTTEKECLAIVWSLRYFHPYIHGATVTIYTDHQALKAILSIKTPRGRIARWILELDRYEFTIVHRKGMDNKDADALSRAYSNNQQILNDEQIKQHQQNDIQIQEWTKIKDDDFKWMKNLFFRRISTSPTKYVIVIPKILCQYYFQLIHDHPTGAHMG